MRLSLPFTVAALTETADNSCSSIRFTDHGSTFGNPFVYPTNNTAYATFFNVTDAGVSTFLDETDVDTAFGFIFQFTYMAA